MKKLIFFLLIITIATFSCDDNYILGLTNTCSVSNPVEDLGWLKSEIQDMQESNSELSQYFYISQAVYAGETVFVFNNCCPNCNTVVPVKNCNGETLGYLGYGDEDINPGALDNSVIIWKPENLGCTVK